MLQSVISYTASSMPIFTVGKEIICVKDGCWLAGEDRNTFQPVGRRGKTVGSFQTPRRFDWAEHTPLTPPLDSVVCRLRFEFPLPCPGAMNQETEWKQRSKYLEGFCANPQSMGK
jgi:hypothetical protein